MSIIQNGRVRNGSAVFDYTYFIVRNSGFFVADCPETCNEEIKIAAMFFIRPGELRQAGRTEIDLDEIVWIIPAEKMKMKQAHIVPYAVRRK